MNRIRCPKHRQEQELDVLRGDVVAARKAPSRERPARSEAAAHRGADRDDVELRRPDEIDDPALEQVVHVDDVVASWRAFIFATETTVSSSARGWP